MHCLLRYNSGRLVRFVLLLVLGMVGCNGESVAPGPDESGAPVSRQFIADSSLSHGAVLTAGIDDALDRSLPSLDPVLQRLARPLLNGIARAVLSGDATAEAAAFTRWDQMQGRLPRGLAVDPEWRTVNHAVRTLRDRPRS